MKTQFDLKPLATIIASLLVLSGCNSGSESVADVVTKPLEQTQDSQQQGSQAADQGEAEVASATVKLGVKFPEPEVGAAWIGDSKTIEVSFYRNDLVGSLDEAEDISDALEECRKEDNNPEPTESFDDGIDNCYELNGNELRERLAKKATLTSESPTSSVDLVPGKYRVEAAFYNAQGELQETSVSYLTLGDGTHSIALRGMSATWTAAEPIALQLLNQSTDVDWDPKTEGNQTAADVLGITSTIAGLHLPSLLSYPDGMSPDDKYRLDAYSAGVLTGFDEGETGQSALFVPVWRINSGGGEIDLHPENQREAGETEQGYAHFEVMSSLAGLFQEYDGQKNNSFIDLGSRSVSLGNNYSEDSNYRGHYAEVIFGAAEGDSDEGDEVWRHKYDERNYTYWDQDTGQQVETDLKIARINTEVDSNGYAQLFLDVLNGSLNRFENGNTISGHFIEVVESFTNSQTPMTPAAMLDASLNEIAAQQGLTAAAASNCDTINVEEVWYSNEYMWDAEQSVWIGGTVNPYVETGTNGWIFNNLEQLRMNHHNSIGWNEGELARVQAERDDLLASGVSEEDIASMYPWIDQQIQQYTLAISNENNGLSQLDAVEAEYKLIADLNGDGSAEIFETGVYFDDWNYGYCQLMDNSTWDNESQMQVYSYSLACEGNTTANKTVQASLFSAEVQMCVQPFTLTASQLDITYPTEGEVIIE